MLKVINNPDLLNLIGMKFHVRDITEYTNFDEENRKILELLRIDGIHWVSTIVFHGESEPEIGLIEHPDDHDNVVFLTPSSMSFSPAGDSQNLPQTMFNPDGSLIGLLGVKQRYADLTVSESPNEQPGLHNAAAPHRHHDQAQL
ncbi:MAG: hypothetical protein Q7L19_05785 [Pseudohongiella sp.]|nr:hypothetical protein [Pseudohongiella sp.]